MTLVKGTFIVFEGGDGAGKSTQIKHCAKYLEGRGISYLVTREPGGCPLAETLRELILKGDNPPTVELMLLMTARAAHINEIIHPALQAGQWVICDRFLDSTLAYQGAGWGIDTETILSLNRMVCGDIVPDLTILLDLPLHVARKRNPIARDGIEARDTDYQQRIYSAFRKLAAASPEDHLVINAELPIKTIQQAITGYLTDNFS